MNAPIHAQIQSLIARLSALCSAGHGFGSMSPSIYDTAWVSMVRNPHTITGSHAWLFPECFEFILTHQLASGAWESYASPIDGILNTAAALLALKVHLEVCPEDSDLELRSQRAVKALREMLGNWEAGSSDQVGFEMLILQHASLLEAKGIVLDFPQLSTLRPLRRAKLEKLPLASVYNAPSTLHHCLEGLIGHIDFDQVRCRRDANGSMVSSPSSTAAYLMNTSAWDDEAEAYLRNALEYGSGRGNGSLPSAWPTGIFEISWVFTTLTESGVVIDEKEALIIGEFVQEGLRRQKGTLGFDIGSFPDVDDTAKGIMTLRILGKSPSIEGLISTFEAGDHFRTYNGERNPSFSANCNVLICLLMLDGPSTHISQIVKVARFLTAQVYKDGVSDKWHLSDLYWVMLLSRPFALLYQDEEVLRKLFDRALNLNEEIPLVTVHLLIRVIHSQRSNGSWDGSCEVTSYATLALLSLARLPWTRQIDLGEITASVARAKSFLLSNRSDWSKGHHIWVEKVTYASDVLSEAYCLAAVFAPIPSAAQPVESESSQFLALPDKRIRAMMRKTGELISHTPLFLNMEAYILRAAEMQACYALSTLQKMPLHAFPRTAKGEDKYLCIIPLAFTACAAAQGYPVSVSVLFDIMVLSVLNFLADEYMEGVVEKEFAGSLDAVRDLIRQLFINVESASTKSESNGNINRIGKDISGNFGAQINGQKSLPAVELDLDNQWKQPSLQNVEDVLRRFVMYVIHHPSVASAPRGYPTRLALDLETFLLAHVTHAEDNHRFGRQQAHLDGNRTKGTQEPNGNGIFSTDEANTHEKLTAHTSADHTSCPFSFVFFNCLVQASSKPGSADIYGSARRAYLAEDLCHHLASLCRMYNDCGSVRRDADEHNLNSISFPEFHTSSSPSSNMEEGTRKGTGEQEAKSELLWIAEYERHGLKTALELLEEELGSRGKHSVDALKPFINVTDLYGQIYVLKDIGTRTK
ncbi:hypothetical protein F4677DRAFT_465656 [Hypoxylon crocopeplum]|nr:hypothetical protein F4677DRAFT_465656 [Hypoxylon crocopeplum]